MTTETLYFVVHNDEEQYSIWPEDKPLPGGWTRVGLAQARQACLAYIEEVWIDITPRSARKGT